ncbi:MAG: hypothetical protein QX199_18445 [Methylococcaceae bacterium]
MKKLFLETATNVIELPQIQIDALLREAKGNVLPPIISDEHLIARYRHGNQIISLHLSQLMHYGRYSLEYLSHSLNEGILHEDCQFEKITSHSIPVELGGIPIE